MKLFEKIIEALEMKLGRAYTLEALSPFVFDGIFPERNVFLQLNNGEMIYGKDEKIKPGNFYFIPQGQHCKLTVGKANKAVNIKDGLVSSEEVRGKYIRNISDENFSISKKEIITIVSFEATLYGAFPLFPLLEIPAFQMPYDEEYNSMVKNICLESRLDKLGREMMLKNYLKILVISLCRHIDEHPELNHYVEKLNYLTDKRLLDIVNYVQENLNKNLSNKAIANVAFVSEDYVGQFFKTLTNRNLQDYIEDQRLAKALHLLKSKPESVQEISHQVGFKDPAYFSRRFKMKFGINAIAVKMGRNQIV